MNSLSFFLITIFLGGVSALAQLSSLPSTIFGSVRGRTAGELIDNPRFQFIVFFQGETVLARVPLEASEDRSQNFVASFQSTGEISVALENDGRRIDLVETAGDFSAFRPAAASRTRWDFSEGVDSGDDSFPDGWESGLQATIFGTVRGASAGNAGAIIDNPLSQFIVFFQGETVLAREPLELSEDLSQNYAVSFQSTGEISVALENDGERVALVETAGDFSSFRPAASTRTRWDFIEEVNRDGGSFPEGLDLSLPATIFGTVRGISPGTAGAVIDNPRFQFIIFFQGETVLARVPLEMNDDLLQNYVASFESTGEISVALENDGIRVALFETAGDFSSFRPAAASRTRWDFIEGVDSDGDKLPDSWELAQSGVGDLSSLNGSNDPDADGFSSRQEFFAGTEPIDPQGAPSFKILGPVSDDWIEVRIEGKRGRFYTLEESSGLVNWRPRSFVIPSNLSEEVMQIRAPRTGSFTVRVPSPTAPNYFIRLGVL